MKRSVVVIACLSILAVSAVVTALYVTIARPLVPRLKVEITGALVYDFGKMSQMQKNSHTWEIKNAGDADLELWTESTSWAANVKLPTTPGAEKPRVKIKPNETIRVELEWQTRGSVNGYTAACEIGTSDPKRPVLMLAARGMVERGGAAVTRRAVDSAYARLLLSRISTAAITLRDESWRGEDDDEASRFSSGGERGPGGGGPGVRRLLGRSVRQVRHRRPKTRRHRNACGRRRRPSSRSRRSIS